MTSSSSNRSSVKPLTEQERAAWAAHNEAEERERYRRFQGMTFSEKLAALEATGAFLSRLRDNAGQRQKQP